MGAVSEMAEGGRKESLIHERNNGNAKEAWYARANKKRETKFVKEQRRHKHVPVTTPTTAFIHTPRCRVCGARDGRNG
jgi:hypothetical protein